MGRIIHFELNVENLDAAEDFYTKVFDWEFIKWENDDDYRLIKTGNPDLIGIDGGLAKAGTKFPPIVNTIEVEDIKLTIAKIIAAGGKMLTDMISMPDVGFLAYFKV